MQYEEDLAAKLRAQQEGTHLPEGAESNMHETAKEWPVIKPVVY